MQKTIITLDIETIPSQREGVFDEYLFQAAQAAEAEIAQIKPPGNIKDPAKIDEWATTVMPAKVKALLDAAKAEAEDKYRATSFNGGKGRIAVVGFAVNDEAPIAFYNEDYKDPATEKSILRNFYDIVGDVVAQSRGVLPVFVGHNVAEFDLRFIKQRSMVLGIAPPPGIPFDAKPWSDTVFDTMTQWAGTRNRVKLSELVEVFDLQAKGDEIGEEIDGSMVWDFVKAGRISDVAKYCAGDVVRARDLYKRMTYQTI